MRLFVTGAAGFIGSNCVRHVLATTDDEVTAFDALTYAGTTANFHDLEGNPRFRFVKGDICERNGALEAMAGHDAVVHFAAESHVDRSIVSPDEFVRTNCDGTNVMCDVARRVGVARFLHISTDEVYGSIDEGSFRETDTLGPRSPYSASKAGSDLIALSYFTTYGLPVLVTRSSNNFGPYQFPEKVIPLFVTNLLEGRKVPLYGDGLNVREWCFVTDNCAGVDLVLRSGSIGEIYNVPAATEVTNRPIVRVLITGADGQVGRELQRAFASHDVVAASRAALDVTDRAGVLAAIATLAPDAVVHAAAFTGVDACETEAARAYAVNTLGT